MSPCVSWNSLGFLSHPAPPLPSGALRVLSPHDAVWEFHNTPRDNAWFSGRLETEPVDENKVQNEPRGAPFPPPVLGMFPLPAPWGLLFPAGAGPPVSLSPAPERGSWPERRGALRSPRRGLGRTGAVPWRDSLQDHPVANPDVEMVTPRLSLTFKQLFSNYSAERRKPVHKNQPTAKRSKLSPGADANRRGAVRLMPAGSQRGRWEVPQGLGSSGAPFGALREHLSSAEACPGGSESPSVPPKPLPAVLLPCCELTAKGCLQTVRKTCQGLLNCCVLPLSLMGDLETAKRGEREEIHPKAAEIPAGLPRLRRGSSAACAPSPRPPHRPAPTAPGKCCSSSSSVRVKGEEL